MCWWRIRFVPARMHQLIQAQTEEEVHLDALANFLQLSAEQLKLDIDDLIDAPSPAGLETIGIAANPEVEQQAALVSQQKEQIRALNRTYAPTFTLYGSASGLGAGLATEELGGQPPRRPPSKAVPRDSFPALTTG